MTGEELPDDARFTEEQLATLTQHLLSRWKGVRQTAVEQLQGVDFEQFERPPKLKLLLAALNAVELREQAIDSLGRVLRGLNPTTTKLDGATLRLLRRSLALAKAYNHPDFQIATCNLLLLVEDTYSIRELETLVERTTLTIHEELRFSRAHARTERVVWSFKGTPEEERNVKRVHSAAHVACQRLKILAEEASKCQGLLRAAHKPVEENLLKPATSSPSTTDHLLPPGDQC